MDNGRIDLKDDQVLFDVVKELQNKKPVIVLRKDVLDRDTCIVFVADQLGVPIVKVGIELLGSNNDVDTYVNFIKKQMKLYSNREYLLWIKNIHSLHKDVQDFLTAVSDYVKTTNNVYLLFSGVDCNPYINGLPYKTVVWSSRYTTIPLSHCTTSFNIRRHRTRVYAPQPIHFRVYNNIYYAVKSLIGGNPDITIENCNGDFADINSIIGTVSLGIQAESIVYISSNYDISLHEKIINTILEAWRADVPVVEDRGMME